MRNLRPSFLSAAALVSLLAVPVVNVHGQYAGSEPPPPALQPGFDSITAQQCEDWLNLLAGPKFEGRGTGQPGHVKAAHWVAGKAAEFGLEPKGEGDTYFQMLPMTRLFVDHEASKLTGSSDLSIPFQGNIGLERFSNQPAVSGKLVFVTMSGDGATLPEDLSLRDKIVVFVTDDAVGAGRTATTLARKRPLAVLRVTESEPTSTPQLQRFQGGRGGGSVNGSILRSAADQLLTAAEGDASWLTVPDANTASVYETDKDITLEIRLREQQTAVPNVLAWQPGSDPELSNEYVVIGAHLDHLGVRGDAIYPGADDNGSGSTALLNIAKAMAINPVKPKRSVLFIWFAAEEMGLLGSKHYVGSPVLPLEDMVCMLNIDMVGRNEEKGSEKAEENIESLHLVGSQKGDLAFHEMILDVNKHVNLKFEFDEEGVFGRSDQYNFFKTGISVAFLFGGFHPDYHKTTDSPDKINHAKIASAAKLFYLAAYEAAVHGPYPVPEEPAQPAGNSGAAAATDAQE